MLEVLPQVKDSKNLTDPERKEIQEYCQKVEQKLSNDNSQNKLARREGMNTFYHGDCKFVMNHDIEPNSIDLIYLDPPFFTGKVQKGTVKWQPGAMEVSYDDSKRFWKEKGLASHAPEWLKHIALTRPDFASYLFYMMERLEACHKVLKDTGSIYLHCDNKASHYLKLIMDDVFGYDNFKNDVVWWYPNKLQDKRKRLFAKETDTILFYVKNNQQPFTYNHQCLKRDKPVKHAMIHKVNGIKVTVKDNNGNTQYMTSTTRVVGNVWNIPMLTGGKERVGYPTQKPLDLLKRIIQASSNEGDTILDPFCGCGTAIIAAQNLNRQWIGIDISKSAYEVSSVRHGELPLQFTHFNYVSRELDEVLSIEKPTDFEKWVNEYFKAHKPNPDKGIDGITPNNIPIQTKTYLVKYPVLSAFITNINHHPKLKQPITHAIIVSQTGFDDGARQRQFEIQTKEGIQVDLLIPAQMLQMGDSI